MLPSAVDIIRLDAGCMLENHPTLGSRVFMDLDLPDNVCSCVDSYLVGIIII